MILSFIPGYDSRIYSVWPRFCRAIPGTMENMVGGCLDKGLLLFDNTGLDWPRLRAQQNLFVRPVLVEGDPPAILLMNWLMVPADTLAKIYDDFGDAVETVGARYRGGEAANLIFLAQLTPVR